MEKFKSLKTIDIGWLQENFNEALFHKIIKLMNCIIKSKDSKSTRTTEEFYVYVGHKYKYEKYSTKYLNLNYLDYDNWIIEQLIKLNIDETTHIINWTGTVNEEILLWTYFNLLDINIGKEEYIRLIKKLLNQNRRINDKCCYYSVGEGQNYEDYIQFGRQIVIGNDNAYDYNVFHCKVIELIKNIINCIGDEISIESILNSLKEHIINEDIDNKNECNTTQFEDICKNEHEKYRAILDNENEGKQIILFENDKLFNGIIDNMWNQENKTCYMDYHTFNGIFKYDDCLDNREGIACRLLSVLQLQAEEPLLYDDVTCKVIKTSAERNVCIPNKDIIDIMVSSKDRISLNIKKYFSNHGYIINIGKYKKLACALGAAKDLNNNKSGNRERVYNNYSGIFKYTRPKHRAERYGDEDQTAALNSIFITGKDTDCYFCKCPNLAEECKVIIEHFMEQFKSNFADYINFEVIKEERDLEKYFFELAELIIGNEFKMNSFIKSLIEIIISNNGEISLRNIKLSPCYKYNESPYITIEFLKEELVYFIYHNSEGKIVVGVR